MKVHISFDKAAVERQGRRLEDVHRTVKTLFILSLLRADWFLDCAASCVWQDENGEEDVLAQAGKAGEKT